MDFIERIFGVSPDGGDGTTEALYLTVAIALGIAWLARNRLRSFLRSRQKR
jgi:hypothetical protein